MNIFGQKLGVENNVFDQHIHLIKNWYFELWEIKNLSNLEIYQSGYLYAQKVDILDQN